jgi:type IV pilus assembly protein PilB
MDQTFRPLLDALKQIGVDPVAVDAAAEEAQRSGRSVRAVLINDQVVTEEQLTTAAAKAFGINTVDLVSFTPDPAALKRIPLPVVLRHRVLGLSMADGELVVGVTDPGDVVALDDVRAATGMNLRPVVVARSEVRRIIERLQRESSDLGDIVDEDPDEQSAMAAQQTSVDDAPIVRYVNNLIEQAVMNRASDLHLEPTEDDMRVRYRIDGVLHEVDMVPRGVMSALISRIKIMSGVDITEKRVPQNGRITAMIRDRTVDLRTATLPTVWGEKIVLRVLDTGGIDLDMNKLGFTQHNLDRFAASFSKPHGMVLVTGPTGSGKSTTLYATLGRISKPEINVITVEDPVEYRLRGINQVQVNAKAGLTFAAVLPAILRSDPDGSPRWASSRSWSARRWTACSPSGSPAASAIGARRRTCRARRS